jgi:hypothetical protein
LSLDVLINFGGHLSSSSSSSNFRQHYSLKLKFIFMRNEPSRKELFKWESPKPK